MPLQRLPPGECGIQPTLPDERDGGPDTSLADALRSADWRGVGGMLQGMDRIVWRDGMKKILGIAIALMALSMGAQTTTPYIQWSWTAGAANGDATVSYTLYQATGSCPASTVSPATSGLSWNIVANGIAGTSYQQMSFPSNATICSYVVAVDAAGVSSNPSNYSQATTNAPAATQPPAPGGLTTKRVN